MSRSIGAGQDPDKVLLFYWNFSMLDQIGTVKARTDIRRRQDETS